MSGPFQHDATAEPTRGVAPDPQASRRRRWLLAVIPALVMPAGIGGCGFVPRRKLDECHRLSQTLRAENARMKDNVLELRAQNQDLSQRAVDDARRLTAQEEAIQRLETSVAAYQSERDKLSTAFETIKRQVRLGASVQPTLGAAGNDALKQFAAAHAGWTFDAKTGTLHAPADRLFEPGTPRLTAEARDALTALAGTVRQSLPEGQVLEVVGQEGGKASPPTEARADANVDSDPSVRRTTLAEHDEPPAGPTSGTPGRFLVTARAAQVRAALTSNAGLAAGRVRLAPPVVDDAAGPSHGPGVSVRLVPATPDLDEKPGANK